ncbi:hypothetical protein H6G54_02245 [Anabaena cylindrica FACHB-243]|uniref:Uncharacterized protein n=1 Tax=Anabaena cylindrica (strain ATCC 27899 / PCC 7122) TaxID=272123 RepID=K9ZKB8_ANACC|nr:MULTISPECIES: hypothetical protein [Anabaena]AFZ59199.1 hypothetical protein Anacy_3821 [Anabaena cylindrica PCC 7122]MBD2416549.1 hypothetical protein [Anabaena cylindrica FACHB-243]MBY5280952.1 hypothetical protein [Anabaena sp. CCAP 1446/1C]MBY5311625.1 hypothetical protein [Anabaena sp. CCAP 1446/1C]MCM2407489.1 hypothetical protein [Anabaena sp. CCAP 1446/1C]
MARAIERIEQDMTMLKEAIRAIATELHSSYVSYLTILGAALQKQLILAAYHLCTQGYSDNFLQLSLNQRQQLQQGIRKLGQKAAMQLLDYLKAEESEVEELEESEETEEVDENPKSEIENPKYLDPSNPIELVQWHEDIEEAIQDTLKKVSHDANFLIQKAGILPKKLPEPILAAAAAASEASAEVIPGPPNLLNLVIEIGNEEEPDDSSVTQLITINLRLGEIEFADTTLLSGRKQIRNILVQLNKAGREYQKKQRELKISEAEAAWRASWFE